MKELDAALILKNKNSVIIGLFLIFLVSILSSQIGSPLAFISPSSEFRWASSVDALQPTYSKGDTVYITGLLEEGSQYIDYGGYYTFTTAENLVWAVTILGPDDLPISFTIGPLTAAEGSITLDTVSYTINQIDPSGTYKVRVVVWTGALPSGDTRTYTILEGSFEVQ